MRRRFIYYINSKGDNSIIQYTTSNGLIVIPSQTAYFGANIIQNTYTDGVGTIVFDGVILYIGSNAFLYCSNLVNITIPDSVTSIGGSAFYECSSLTSVTIPDSVTEIGDYAFWDCSSLTSVTIGNSVTSIGYDAFKGCTGELTVTCNRISNFGNSNFSNVIIGDGATSIETGAFQDCTSLTSVTIPDSVTSIGNYAFENCSSLTSVTIPDSVTSIGYRAFNGCSNLTSITIPDSVTYIEAQTFAHCSSLTSITIPDSVTSIGYYAFKGCSSITSITIPDSVTSIGDEAFWDCTSLKAVYCKPTTPPSGEYNMFSNNATGRKIYVPYQSLEAYKTASFWSAHADNILPWDVENDKTDGSTITLSNYRYYPKVTQYLMNKYGLGYGTKSNPLPIEEKIILSDSFSGSLGGSSGEVLYISTESSWDESFGIRLYLGDYTSTFMCVALETCGTNPGFGCARSNFYD